MAAKSPIEDDSKVMDVAKPGKGKIISTSRPIITSAPVVSQQTDASPIAPDKESEEALSPPSARQKVIQPAHALTNESEEAAAQEPEAKPEPEQKPDMSESAGVDELAKSVVDKKKAAEQSKLDAERDQHVQELIDSKQYVVPIGRAVTKGGKKWLFGLPIVLLLLAGGYLLVDANVFGSGIKLPYEFIKDDSAVNDSSAERDSVETDPADTKPTETTGEKNDTPTTPVDPGATTPEDRANDDDAMNELKNLQVKLETYFNDNDAYPMSLTDLRPMPTADELQDSQQQSYGYTTDGQTYVLTAKLSDGTNYTLESVNASN